MAAKTLDRLSLNMLSLTPAAMVSSINLIMMLGEGLRGY